MLLNPVAMSDEQRLFTAEGVAQLRQRHTVAGKFDAERSRKTVCKAIARSSTPSMGVILSGESPVCLFPVLSTRGHYTK